MKLESVNLDKFKKEALKKEHMFMLNGAGTETPGGTMPNAQPRPYAYGFDSDRGNGVITYHNRTALR
jgi:hypothetical protein